MSVKNKNLQKLCGDCNVRNWKGRCSRKYTGLDRTKVTGWSPSRERSTIMGLDEVDERQ
jgi:hypothetical protein